MREKDFQETREVWEFGKFGKFGKSEPHLFHLHLHHALLFPGGKGVRGGHIIIDEQLGCQWNQRFFCDESVGAQRKISGEDQRILSEILNRRDQFSQ
jgi:hypothetical protein